MRSIPRTRAAAALVVAALLAVSLPAAVSARSAAGPAAAAGAHGPVAAAACTRGAKACPIRIVFLPGAYAGQRSAVFTSPTQEKWFSVRATQGQTMVVVIDGKGATGGTLYFPNGTQDGGPGGRVFDGQVPATGITKIRVAEDMMAEQWTGLVTVVVLLY
jgi:hypothetical protein